jgi:hypothetical protein
LLFSVAVVVLHSLFLHLLKFSLSQNTHPRPKLFKTKNCQWSVTQIITHFHIKYLSQKKFFLFLIQIFVTTYWLCS